MKKIDLVQMIGVVANFGVIAGIIFLGLELRQTQLLARAQMRNDIAQQRIEITQYDMAGPSIDLLVRYSNGDELSEADSFRLTVYYEMWLAHFENLHYQYSQGLYGDDGQLGDPAGYMGRVFAFQPLQDFFCRYRTGYSRSFVNYVEQDLGVSCD